MNTNFYSIGELKELGLHEYGSNVLIDRSCRFYGAGKIRLGSNVRIDCFSLITADEFVTIGNNVHLAAGVQIFGNAGVTIEDYCGISSRCSIFSTSDDYSGGHLTNPTIPEEFKKVTRAPVKLCKHSIIGCGSVVMPGVIIGFGAAVGALSFVNKSVPGFAVVSGIPLHKVGTRNGELLKQMQLKYEEQVGHHKANLSEH
jgi:acetyltransferase-like isoleucine patch superfamily enzyme